MKYFLDTCVISDLVKRNPNRNVVKWISNISEEYMFLSVFTFAELHKGVEKLPKGKKRNQLHSWINEDLMQRFEGKIIDFDVFPNDDTTSIAQKLSHRLHGVQSIKPFKKYYIDLEYFDYISNSIDWVSLSKN